MKMYDDFRLFVAPGAAGGLRRVGDVRRAQLSVGARPVAGAVVLRDRRRHLMLSRARRSGARWPPPSSRGRSRAPSTSAEPQHVQQLRGRLDAAGVAARAGARSRRGGPPARSRAGRRRRRDRDVVPADEGARAARRGVGLTLFAGRGCGGVQAAAVLVGAAAAVVAPLLLIWRPSVLLREWFLVPLGGNYLGQTSASRPLAVGAVLVVAAMAAIADPPARSAAGRRDRRASRAARQPAAQHGRAPRGGEPFRWCVFVPWRCSGSSAPAPGTRVPANSPPQS